MRITQGTFSFLPDLTDEQIAAQVRYALGHGWAIAIEYTDDPHPRNAYWDMWGPPLFDLAPFRLVGTPDGQRVHLEAQGPDGQTTMSAEAELS